MMCFLSQVYARDNDEGRRGSLIFRGRGSGGRSGPQKSTRRGQERSRPPQVIQLGLYRWRRGVAVTSLGVSTKLLYVGPG